MATFLAIFSQHNLFLSEKLRYGSDLTFCRLNISQNNDTVFYESNLGFSNSYFFKIETFVRQLN